MVNYVLLLKRMAAIPAMLTFGTATVVTQKILFSMKGHGKKNNDTFNRPWFQTNSMFIGMFLCLVLYEILHIIGFIRKLIMKAMKTTPKVEENVDAMEEGEDERLVKDDTIQQEGDGEEPRQKTARWKTYLYVIVPAMCDLCATAMMNIGLLWIPPSVWQMLRGSMVIFSALLSILFLKRKLYAYNWIAIAMCISALLIVGVACLKMPTPDGQKSDGDGSSSSGGGDSSSHTVEGIVLVVLAQVIQSSQIVIEEFLLKQVQAAPLFIVGLEGLWGMIVCCAVCLPIVGYVHMEGIHEDTIDTLIMFFRTPAILFTGIFYMFAIFVYNFSGMMVTNLFTAVHRTILEAARTACIWIVNLFIYYVCTHRFGEAWTSWSWMELFGFVVLTFGMLLYNRVILIPGLYYPPPEDFSKLPSRPKKVEGLEDNEEEDTLAGIMDAPGEPVE